MKLLYLVRKNGGEEVRAIFFFFWVRVVVGSVATLAERASAGGLNCWTECVDMNLFDLMSVIRVHGRGVHVPQNSDLGNH